MAGPEATAQSETWQVLSKPQEIVEYCAGLLPSKNCLETVLSNWIWMSLLEEGDWTRWPPDVPSNLNHSMVL